MLRPTLGEIVSGIRRTILETLAPELASPYAQSQAATAANLLSYVAGSLQTAADYDRGEIEDLSRTFLAIEAAASPPATLLARLEAATSAARHTPPARA